LHEEIQRRLITFGGYADPHAAFLLWRGMRTFRVRLTKVLRDRRCGRRSLGVRAGRTPGQHAVQFLALNMTSEERLAAGIQPGAVRLSIGLEGEDALLEDSGNLDVTSDAAG